LEAKMNFILNLIFTSSEQVWLAFVHNWPFLLVSVALAALLKLALDPRRVSAFMLRHQKVGVAGATALAVTTPLCSCGTTAIVLGMIANFMPWAPIVAFMVASPLTSPEGLVYSAGLFGWRFALAFYAASIVLGFAGGGVAAIFDRRGWLANQTRQTLTPGNTREQINRGIHNPAPPSPARPAAILQPARLALEPAGCACEPAGSAQLLALETVGCACGSVERPLAVHLTQPGCDRCETGLEQPAVETTCGCAGNTAEKTRTARLNVFLAEFLDTGKRLLVMFFGFAFIGYVLNGLIPPAWVAAVFGGGNVYSVPLAATLGLPLYVNSEASLPLVRAMLESGMSEGAALAFLISGSGTSFGAIAGMLTIARWRVVTLVVGTLWVGAVLFGVLYDIVW
jgi:uncharacterized membrane protein YraQ (UPF0718 family)